MFWEPPSSAIFLGFSTQTFVRYGSMDLFSALLLRPLRRLRVLFLLAVVVTMGCRPQSQSSTTAEKRNAVESAGQSRDLSQDEAAGGHTLRKHVGRSDEQLRERLQRERDISAASTWNDRASAEAAVGAAIAQQNGKIGRWLERQSGHPNFVLDYDGDSAHPFGRTLRRGQDQVEPCAHATIVLKWDGPNSYHVLTAYPECR